MTYDGPTRYEILRQIHKYNYNHQKVDNILVTVSKSDLLVLQQLERNENNASESTKQLKESINELQKLRRVHVKRGPRPSRSDWVSVRSTGRKLVEAADKGIARYDARAELEAQGRQKIKDELARAARKLVLPSSPTKNRGDQRPKSPRPAPKGTANLPQAVMKPILPSSPTKNRRQERPLSPQPAPAIRADYSKKVMKPPVLPASPRKEIRVHEPQRPQSPLRSVPMIRKPDPPRHQSAQPAKKQEGKRPQSPEEKRCQRKFVIEQREALAQYEARKLHSEVRKFGNEE